VGARARSVGVLDKKGVAKAIATVNRPLQWKTNFQTRVVEVFCPLYRDCNVVEVVILSLLNDEANVNVDSQLEALSN